MNCDPNQNRTIPVMSDDAIKDIVLKHYEANPKLWDGIISIRMGDDLEVAKAQAEISFKAGEDQGYKNGSISGYNEATKKALTAIDDALKTGYKAGIREVVEWVEQYKLGYTAECGTEFNFTKEQWQAFKESKGVK